MGRSRKDRTSRWLGLIGAVAVLAVALPVAAQDETGNPYYETGAEADSGEGIKIGYISLGDSLPFVKLVSESIQEQADIAGVDLVFCDSMVDDAQALQCAQQMAVQEVQGVINFQLNESISPEICAAYNDLPTVASTSTSNPARRRSSEPTTTSPDSCQVRPSGSTSPTSSIASTTRS